MKIRFSYIHSALALFSMVAVSSSFFFNIDTYYSDANRWLMLALLALYGLFFRPAVVIKHPIIGYFGIFIYLFVCQRFVIASFYTAHNWEHYYYTDTMVQETLWMMFAYIAVFYIVLWMLRGQFSHIISNVRSSAKQINYIDHKFKLAAAFVLVVGFLSFVVVFNESVNGHNNALTSSLFHRFFLRLIIPEFFLALLFGLFLLSCENRRKYRNLFVFVLIYFVLIRVAQGSKSGIFDLGILFLMYLGFFNSYFRLKINVKTLTISVMVIAASILIFSVIGYIRFTIWYHAADAYAGLELANDPIVRLWNSLSEISRRLGIFDDAMKVIYWRELGFYDISNYVNVETVTKLSLDAFIPSVIYPDLLKAQYALALMIGNEPTIINGAPVYAGYWWGFFGYHIYVFGFYTGLVVMTVFIVLTTWFIRIVMALSTNTFKLAFVFLFIPQFFLYFVGTFGYEHVLSLYFNILVLWIINYVVFVVADTLARKRSSRALVNVKHLTQNRANSNRA